MSHATRPPPFALGPSYLLQVAQTVCSSEWRGRFAPYLHDSMCCDEEWKFRLAQRLEFVTLQSPPDEIERARANAYSDSEKRREVHALTPFTRSLVGIRDTLNHILLRFGPAPDDQLPRHFSSVIYPTLRQAVIDLHNPANAVATSLHCETLQRAVRFLIQMFCTASSAAVDEFLGDKCLTIAKQLLEYACPAHCPLCFLPALTRPPLLRPCAVYSHHLSPLSHLLGAYKQLWYRLVFLQDSCEFCALILLSSFLCCPSPDFLSFNACYACLPQRVRSSPEVSQAVVIAQCFFSDSIVRLFEQLHTAPYLVVVLVLSRLGQLRGRCVKYLAVTKLTLPFDMIVRYSLARACLLQLTARRHLGLCPHVPEQRARAAFALRSICKQHDASAAPGGVSRASLPLFGFDPDSQADISQVNFLQKGSWAQDSKGAFSLRLHVQAIHVRASCCLARMDIRSEPALSQHPRKLNSWREALSVADDRSSPLQSAACIDIIEPAPQDCGSLASLNAAEPTCSLLPPTPSITHTFVFKSWPRMCDCECSVVHLA
jgi:hypothetical protein